MKIYIYGNYQDWQKKVLFDLLPSEFEFEWGKDIPSKKDYEVLVWGVPEERFISSADNLKYVIVPYAGISAHTIDLIKKYPFIQLHNLHHNALPTAEMAFSLLLTAAKSIIPAHNKLARGDWTPRYEGLANRLLAGKNILILGYGSVGKYLAKMCLGMQATVQATRYSCQKTYSEDGVEIHPASELDILLPLAQILLVTLPFTAKTNNLLDHHKLSLLPEKNLLVNIGRGKIIEEKSLYHALKSGKIAAAGIDVWYNYPRSIDARNHTYPSDYSFHELENVVLSPHRGGSFANYDTELLRVRHLAELLNKFHETKVMPNQVDIERGY